MQFQHNPYHYDDFSARALTVEYCEPEDAQAVKPSGDFTATRSRSADDEFDTRSTASEGNTDGASHCSYTPEPYVFADYGYSTAPYYTAYYQYDEAAYYCEPPMTPPAYASNIGPATDGALRTDLIPYVTFVRYPEEAHGNETLRPNAPFPRPAHVKQLFIGQVPFRITDAQLLFLFEKIANVDLLYIERVVQSDSRKGCIQLFLHADDVAAATSAIHKRVLFDATGFWYAGSEDEQQIMNMHCTMPEYSRHKGMPFNCVVLEEARSTFSLACAQSAAQRRARVANSNGDWPEFQLTADKFRGMYGQPRRSSAAPAREDRRLSDDE